MLGLRTALLTPIALTLLGSLIFSMPASAALRGHTPERKAAEKTKMPKGMLLKTIQQGDEEYKYVLYVPADYDGRKAYPTIIFMNGAGECGRDGFKQAAVGLGPAVMQNVDKWPFLILMPQKPTVKSNWEDFDDLVMAMLAKTRSEYKVDGNRLYLTGLSQGGHGTWAIGAKHPDLFAAIAPICGWGEADTATTLKSLPIWCFHGEADPVVPVKRSQDMVNAVKTAGGDVKLTTYPGVGHDSWNNAYGKEDLGTWFLQHQKNERSK